MTEEQTATPAVVNEWVEHFEKEMGHKPTDTSIRIASLAYELGRQMEDRGYNDKQAAREPLPFSSFEAVARSIIAGTTVAAVQCANTVAQILHENYMIGYNGEKEGPECPGT